MGWRGRSGERWVEGFPGDWRCRWGCRSGKGAETAAVKTQTAPVKAARGQQWMPLFFGLWKGCWAAPAGTLGLLLQAQKLRGVCPSRSNLPDTLTPLDRSCLSPSVSWICPVPPPSSSPGEGGEKVQLLIK